MSRSVQGRLFGGPSLTKHGTEAMCAHEAAHAVLLTVDGGRVTRIIADSDIYAGVKGRGWTKRAVLAGIAAERVGEYATLGHPAALSRSALRVAGWGDDLRRYRALGGRARDLRRDLEEAEEAVREWWDTIRAVADALGERGELEPERVREIIPGTEATGDAYARIGQRPAASSLLRTGRPGGGARRAFLGRKGHGVPGAFLRPERER